jgi:DNA-binding SARP family transcriptional activator
MSRVELRFLGGFDARLDGKDLGGFESRKSRALLAYLALNRERQVERRFLAGLLWSERSEVSARRNLRQALHNIRGTFSVAADLPPIFTGLRGSVQLNPELDCWVDVEAFRHAVRSGLESDDNDTTELASAARLYSGDLLVGFGLGDCPVFEEWLEGEQERLRRAAVSVYRRLVEGSLEGGDYRRGIDYAHRLLTIEPTSEETHRQLMRLYSGAGRHSRALTQFKQLEQLLDRELGVQPMPETVELYEHLLEARDAGGDDTSEPSVGPVLPLEGRAAELRRLRAQWQDARDGHGGLTLLVGEEGIGKTRLARSFLAHVASEGGVTIRTASLAPPPADDDSAVARLVDGPIPSGAAAVLHIDNLQWAGDEDLVALKRLTERIQRQPIWVLACCTSGADLSSFHQPEDRVQHLSLDRLHERAIATICCGLLDLADAQRLTLFVARWSGGNPLAMAEMVNYLWDAGVLVSQPSGRWSLAGSLPTRPADFTALIGRRLAQLPTSARRLLVVAALLGHRFDRETLVAAGDEHPAVVDACVEVLLDRWLIRWTSQAWTSTRPGSDVDRWNRGHREGTLEFAHERVRWAVLGGLSTDRLQALRRQVSERLASDVPAVETGQPSSLTS